MKENASHKNKTIYTEHNKVVHIMPSVNNKNKFLEGIYCTLEDLSVAYLTATKLQQTSSEFNYNFKYCLYYATDNKDVKFEEDTTYIGADFDEDLPPQNLLKYMTGSILIENNYQYKGYKVLHNDFLSGDRLNMDFNSYALNIYNILGKKIISTNESLENPDFIDFNKHTVLIITSLRSN
jgi:hypothetical protein